MAATDDSERVPSLRERIAALRYTKPLIKLVWSTHRPLSGAMVVLRVFRAFTPIGELWTQKLILDAVVRDIQTRTPDWWLLGKLIGIRLAIMIAADLLARGSILVESLLGDLFANRISVRIMEHSSTLDLAQFENPTFYDLMERARRETVGRIGLLTQALGILQDMLTVITLLGALIAYSPILLVILIVTIIPSLIGQTQFAAMGYSLLFRWTPERRLLDYLRFLAASDRTAKEVQSFGLSTWLTDRFRVLAHRFYEANRSLSIRKARASALLSIIGTLGFFTAYVVITVKTALNQIGIGDWTLLTGSFSQSRDILQRLLIQAGDVYEQALYLRDLFAFFDIRPTVTSRLGAPTIPRPITAGFVFEDVGFRYPGSDRWAVRHVNLRLAKGERIALVGENGAGKTTITKLIARLYDPSEGRILLDGIDLRDYDLAALRNAIAVIFQDFVRFDFAFDENIGVGQIDSTRDYLDQAESQETAFETRRGANGVGPDAGDRSRARVKTGRTGEMTPTGKVAPFPPIARAAEQSLATTLLPRLPHGYRQMLGRRFEGGVDLSGGEWQRVALARAYLRDAQVLILDEPTAALDARSEYEVFLRFSELVRGRMAVLISHRFSTVRMADRIVVLQGGSEGGHIVEEGTHDELIARGGLYAELFSLQAAGYR